MKSTKPLLRGLLVCPSCHGDLEEVASPAGHRCAACPADYQLGEGGVPMLIEAATAIGKQAETEEGINLTHRRGGIPSSRLQRR